jgi:hypothetical protein
MKLNLESSIKTRQPFSIGGENLEFRGQEDVKNLICWGFRDFIFDPRCLPTRHRSLIGHPGEIF